MTRTIVLPALMMLLLAAFTVGCTASAPDATGADGPWAEVSADAQAALSPDADMLVPAQHVLEAVDAGVNITFVDARTPLDYEFGHIPGALNIPYYETNEHLEPLDPGQLYVVYCECPHAEAVQVADEMTAAGFVNAKVIDEGLYGWTQGGGETVGGTAESSTDGN